MSCSALGSDHSRFSRSRTGSRGAKLPVPAAKAGVDLVALEDSLNKLAELNERHARVVELRMLGALTLAETADVLEISHGTVESDWAMAKAWLRTELSGAE